ncbi:hypothetical protein QBC46DRAFT_450115 [Diplogelasinospora grovesii]|uniref:HNH nuclease domain-containing protein n=1 Tax=Diplogelasinospora grovesii TaxID=303347 RepID=A0AAN6N799_9PEZI|nr:hypothetical protein QBC46DRAFT_450115 [Diplogelasinospora grovesii]
MSSLTVTPSGPPQILKRTSSKRGREDLERNYKILKSDLEDARKKVRPSSSFDANYWASAAATCNVSIQLFETEAELAMQKWTEEEDGDARSWFKGALIKAYGAAITRPNKPKVIVSLHDSATGLDLVQALVTAAHLVPHKLGPDILVALFGAELGIYLTRVTNLCFGVNVEGELYTPFNGLLLHVDVEKALDDGAIAIVPDLPDDPSTQEVADWEAKEPKNYRWRIIDSDADSLNEILVLRGEGLPRDITIRDLDGQQLSFKNNQRPRARYLYFLYVVAELKMAWRHDYRKEPGKILKSQLGKGFWATRRRYLNRALLLALAEEIGHNPDFSENIPPEPGDDNDKEPDETGLIAIAEMIQSQKPTEDVEYEEYEEED